MGSGRARPRAGAGAGPGGAAIRSRGSSTSRAEHDDPARRRHRHRRDRLRRPAARAVPAEPPHDAGPGPGDEALPRHAAAAKIGPAPNISVVYPASSRPEDVLAASDYNAIRNWLYLDMAAYGTYNPTAWAWMTEKGIAPELAEGDLETLSAARADFVAINYYTTATVAAPLDNGEVTFEGGDQQLAVGEPGVFRAVSNPNLATTEFGWEIDAIGFRTTLRDVYDRYRLPVMVTENGLGGYDTVENGEIHDGYRIDYLAEHVEQMRLAVTDGVDVIGYHPWSAMDLISTHQGVAKRYGFIYVDRDEFDLKELRRIRKDSFFWYQQLIKSNGES
ncbi:family 1 glycosylhydrolase [Streptomyces sp. NPDC091371]|uniref:glycoside hydrolase family 1 protein n=1 Tax=Streptomyces sp. NPDC091371 TaxID=3155303 RepID=UPI0034141688